MGDCNRLFKKSSPYSLGKQVLFIAAGNNATEQIISTLKISTHLYAARRIPMLLTGYLRCLFRKITLRKVLVSVCLATIFYGYFAVIYSDTIFDPCLLNKCHEESECIPSFHEYNCKCRDGFYGNGWECFDLDECILNIYNCTPNSQCINQYGTYTCECQEGYNKTRDICKEIPRQKRRNCIAKSKVGYPQCRSKVEWMKKHWQTDPCYKHNGIDGTACSILDYFETVEVFCMPNKETPRKKNVEQFQLTINPLHILSKNKLLTILGNTKNFKWISNRISSKWEDSLLALKNLQSQGKLVDRKNKKVLVFIGALADKKWSWAANAEKGGPLGELVQWSDLISAIYLLGYFLVTSADVNDLNRDFTLNLCKNVIKLYEFDLVYTDIHGIQLMEKHHIDLERIRCKLRVLDSFGTEARFNFINAEYLVNNQSYKISKDQSQSLISNPYGYGNWKLHLKQFLTLFPHSPDNSFLGFVVGNSTHPSIDMSDKTNSCLVYGKQKYMWQGKSEYLKTISKYCEIHATVSSTAVGGSKGHAKKLPTFVKNFGVLKWNNVQSELKKVKIFIGLGFPYEGPAPLEAMANGAIFINPKLKPSHGRLHDIQHDRKYFFKGKPTLRELTSQHPYLEQFVGKPHIYTIDIKNSTELELALQEIMQNFERKKMAAYLPYEFTHEGLLERLNAYIQNQDYCSKESKPSWPPKSALNVTMATPHQSCKSACEIKGLICDNDMFHYVNEVSLANSTSGFKCKTVTKTQSLNAPYIKSEHCYYQTEALLFSCIDASQSEKISRICPCRDFRRGQVALCKTC